MLLIYIYILLYVNNDPIHSHISTYIFYIGHSKLMLCIPDNLRRILAFFCDSRNSPLVVLFSSINEPSQCERMKIC